MYTPKTTAYIAAFLLSALEFAHPFQWSVKQEELWLYRNPHLPEKVPVSLLLVHTHTQSAPPITQTHILPFSPSTSLSQIVGIGLPSAFILVHYFATGDRSDLIQALLSLSLAVLLTGIINDTIKVCAGR